MSTERTARLIDQVIDSLDRERDLLIAGAYDTLSEEADAREANIARLAAAPVGGLGALRPRLLKLGASLARNAALLRAALDGAAAGRRRLAEILEARTALPSYDASGAPVERSMRLGDGRRA